MLLVLSAAAAVGAISVGGLVGDALAIVSLVGFSALILILSFRASQILARLESPTYVVESASAVHDVRDAQRMTEAIEMLQAASLRLDKSPDGFGLLDSSRLDASPLVTLVVPCYNEQRFVGEALRSILQQSFTNWECLVVDDASTDNSLGQIWSVARLDERFHVLRHRVNSGLSAARNTGLRAARGRFIAFLDADDLLMRESLMDRVVALANYLDEPHVLGSYCGVLVAAQEVTLEELPLSLEFETGRIVDLISADAECPFNAHAPLMRVDFLRSLGGFTESMRAGAEDWDLWYRAMRNGYVFVPSRHTTAVYRQKRRSMVRTMPDGHMTEADRLIDAAHRPVDPSILIHPSPTPLPEPIGHYQALLRRADRAIRFAGMALTAGNEKAAESALRVLEEVPLVLVERHLNLENIGDRGIMRALAVNPRELESVDRLSRPVRRRLRALIERVSSRYAPRTLPPVSPPTIRALLVPQHAGQLADMMKTAGTHGFSEEEMAVLETDREGGRQGVEGELPAGMTRWSLNQWTLRGGVCEALFVGSVRTGVVDQVAHAIADQSGLVIQVPQQHTDLMRLSESNREDPSEAGRRPTTVGTRLFGRDLESRGGDPAAWREVEEYPGAPFDAVDMARFKDIHRGDRVVIIGNGPSLNELDLTRLKPEYTIAVNGIFYATENMGFDPSYYVVEDSAVIRDNLAEIIAYDAGHKFFPSSYRNMIGEHSNVSYFMLNRGFYEPKCPDYCVPRFSVDPSQYVFSGQSVTLVNLQLAYHLGFEEVVLIGMDFSYTVPADAVVEGDLITSRSGDPNHFHPDYFGPGKVWKDPKLDRVLANYALAKQIYEANDRRIVNATAGGKLELFNRISYTDLFG